MTLIDFWLSRRGELAVLVEQHLLLVVVSTSLAVALGVPAGVLAAGRPRAGRSLVLLANVAQTVPSLALLGFLLPLPLVGGIGPRTALVALSIYALLPIMRTTITGIQGVDPAVVEAGTAMGMTRRQLLWLVELPLALPSMVAGVRVATVIGVGTATIAAAIGAGGLGEYIFRGLSMVDTTTILAGAIPAAVLALAADGLLAWTERRLAHSRQRGAGFVSIAAGAALLLVLLVAARSGTGADSIVVGSKNFTEQVILGELVAQAIEAESQVPVVRKLNLGGTFVCDRGLRTGDLDVYVEYTGTAVTAVFHQEVPHDSEQALLRARELYARAGLTVARPLGFNNTFAILVRGKDARTAGLRTIEDLRSVAARWTPGFGYEFLQREDGYGALARAYGLRFGSQPRAMDLSLIYRALADGQVDVIAGDRTSALITTLDLVMLEDNRHYFPPYDAVPVVRIATLLREPSIGRALARLAGKISDQDMRRLNAAVDVEHRDVRTVVREFLARPQTAGSSDAPPTEGTVTR
ncbi:MAG: glycine/betaine ABC transporter substrate-binding protein [Acidobacteria bacterium]|nr:MAG: glycine/betaine ABC transporter substrate-binding protein [Acidobacteriota bacterium]